MQELFSRGKGRSDQINTLYHVGILTIIYS